MFRLVFSFFIFFNFLKIAIFTAKKIIYTITVCGSICYTLQWRFFRIAATAKSLQNHSLLIVKSLIISRVLFCSITAKVFYLYNYHDKSLSFWPFFFAAIAAKGSRNGIFWSEKKESRSLQTTTFFVNMSSP